MLGYAAKDATRTTQTKVNQLRWLWGVIDYQSKGYVSQSDFQCLETNYYDRVTPIGSGAMKQEIEEEEQAILANDDHLDNIVSKKPQYSLLPPEGDGNPVELAKNRIQRMVNMRLHEQQ